MSNKLFVSTVLAAGLVGMAASASAHELAYTAPLLGSSEVPVADTPASGSVLVTIDFDLVTMRVQANFEDLIGTTTAAHIHCCTPPGANVGVATQLPSFVGFPLDVSAGSYDQTFDMSLDSSWNPAFVAGNGGSVGSAFNVLAAALDAGNAYFNVHTSSFPGGEIRGLLQPVPLPAAAWLMTPALGLLVGCARRRAV